MSSLPSFSLFLALNSEVAQARWSARPLGRALYQRAKVGRGGGDEEPHDKAKQPKNGAEDLDNEDLHKPGDSEYLALWPEGKVVKR